MRRQLVLFGHVCVRGSAIRKLVKASWHWTGVCSCHPFMSAQHSMIGIAVS